jgi:hypothetical protein
MFHHLSCKGVEDTAVDAYLFDQKSAYLAFTKPIVYSLSPQRIICNVLYASDAAGKEVAFSAYSSISSFLPTDIESIADAIVTADGPYLSVTVPTQDHKVDIRLTVLADVQRVAGVSSNCSAPTTEFLSVTGTEWFRFTLSTSPLTEPVGTVCVFTAHILISPFGGSMSLQYVYHYDEDTELDMLLPLPDLSEVQMSVAEAEVVTGADMTLRGWVKADAGAAGAIELSNIWGLENGITDPYVINESTRMYVPMENPDVLTVQWYAEHADIIKFPIVPMLGAFPIKPQSTELTLFLRSEAFPGRVFLPPVETALAVDIPHAPRPGQPFTVQATFAVPMIKGPRMWMVMNYTGWPVESVSSCFIEQTRTDAVVIDNHEKLISVELNTVRSRSPGQGSVQIQLPHVTVSCVVVLSAAERALVDSAHSPMDIQVTDVVYLNRETEVFARGVAVLPPPLLPPATATILPLELADTGILSAVSMATIVNAVQGSIGGMGGLPDGAVVRLVDQFEETTVKGDVLVVTLLFVAPNEKPVIIAMIDQELHAIIAAINHLGYMIDARPSRELRVDAMAAYECGGGTLCLPGDVCAWDSSCLSGVCGEDGRCVQENKKKDSKSWFVWVVVVACVMVVVCVAVVVYLQMSNNKYARELEEEKLIDDKHDETSSTVSLNIESR